MIFIYGPPGSGKSTIGMNLAMLLGVPFCDLDEMITRQAGKSIPEIFATEGEIGFRGREKSAIKEALITEPCVISLGGGALLDEENRHLVEEHGKVLCLGAEMDVLAARLHNDTGLRPKIVDPDSESEIGAKGKQQVSIQRLSSLIEERRDHYRLFQLYLDTSHLSIQEAVWQAQVRLGIFRVKGMGQAYDVITADGGVSQLVNMIQANKLAGPLVIVSDRNIAPLYAESLSRTLNNSGYETGELVIPAGEGFKNLKTLQDLWAGFLKLGIERSSTIIALGGGVISDLAGFAAATYLRGIRWVSLPTSLLAMVDASLGGKTGIDLPQGKNLIGSFYAPAFVLADPQFLQTLPDREFRSGMAEVVKHGIIGDPLLFEICSKGATFIKEHMDEVIRRAMAVKVKIILADPYEAGSRASLNLGHTLGHALEKVTRYKLSHGEAVSIGIVAATRLAESIGVAEKALSEQIISVLENLGLPVAIPDELDIAGLLDAMVLDKKKKGGVVKMVLPVKVGEVRFGVSMEDLSDLIHHD